MKEKKRLINRTIKNGDNSSETSFGGGSGSGSGSGNGKGGILVKSILERFY